MMCNICKTGSLHGFGTIFAAPGPCGVDSAQCLLNLTPVARILYIICHAWRLWYGRCTIFAPPGPRGVDSVQCLQHLQPVARILTHICTTCRLWWGFCAIFCNTWALLCGFCVIFSPLNLLYLSSTENFNGKPTGLVYFNGKPTGWAENQPVCRFS